MYSGHQPKRRKKRPIHGVKTVDVTRGKSGYGFTISGQHPCVLSCIVASSPAEKMGLHPGDYLVSVNGIDVSKMSHDEVVRMVGMSTGTLTIQVAENYNSSDSSDDEYVNRAKAKYPTRMKQRQKSYGEKMERILADINQRDRQCPDGHSHDPNSRPLPQSGNQKYEPQRSRSLRPRVHMPVGAENHEIEANGLSYIEAGASNVFKMPFQKSVSASTVQTSVPKHHRVEPKQAFIKSTSQSHVKSLPTHQSAQQNPSHMGGQGHMYDHFSPNSLQQIINHSLHSYSAANEAFIVTEEDFDEDGEDDPLQPEGEIRIVVGYIGSLEMPGDANQPHVRIQSIRNAVRRLRVEQKIHTLVLMIVLPDIGVKLINMAGKEIAYYPVDRLAFSGVCPDDRRFFGIVTLHKMDRESSSDSEEAEETIGSSCHVFMVDHELTAHNIHAQKAKSFGIECTVDPNTQRCLEFPRSTTPIIISISNLYKNRPGGCIENDVARSQVFANPNRPVEHVRSSSSSSQNSNSDSGLGLCREDNAAEMPPPPLPARERPPLAAALQPQLQQQLPQIQWSGNTMYLTDGPIKRVSLSDTEHSSSNSQQSKRHLHTPQPDLSTSGEELMADKLNLRAMPDPTPARKRLSGDGLENQNAAENLRLGMHKLLQARQKQAHDTISSDSESRSFCSDNSAQTQTRERPVSAPFNYLSNDSNSDQKTLSPDFSNIKHDSDSSLADKLSPRAFLSSAFTPVGSVSSAFKNVRTRPRLHEMRSPSAPPIPSYHGDDEDSEEEDMKGLIKRMQKEKSLGGSEPRKSANRKRDQERKGVSGVGTPELLTKSTVGNAADKWTKGGAGSLRKKSTRRNPLSLSHESLVVFEQEGTQQKLTSANSVNSIVNHVAKTVEQEEVGRVSGWAVAFDKLLKDQIGVDVFTDFLKGEFSEENILFWRTCEDFKNIVDSNYRKSKAQEIYDQYISVRAQDCVNIDSVARKQVEGQLDCPSPHTFDLPQQQIFQLMKQDSYARFLKSDLYKSYMMKEMEGKPIVSNKEETTDKLTNKHNEKDSKKKGKGKENEENKDKRRRSLLPWRSKSKKTSKSDIDKANKSKEKEASENNNNNNNLPSKVTSNEVNVNTKKEVALVEVPETIDEEPEPPKFCRVIMPDGSTTVVGTKQGQTINYVLGKLLEKRNLSIATVDVFLLGSEKPLNLHDDITSLGSKEVTIERRVLFRMDLPNKKSIGVKAKPNRMIRDVFKPILNKYGYRMDAIDVHLCGQQEVLNLDSLVSTIDSQRVMVFTQSSDTPARKNGLFGKYITSSRPPLPNKHTLKHRLHGNTNSRDKTSSINHNKSHSISSLDEVTNQIFGTLMLDKSDQLLVSDNFDELGILDPETPSKVQTEDARHSLDSLVKKGEEAARQETMGTRDTGKTGRTRPKVTFDLPKNTPQSQQNDSEEDLCERLKRAQNLSLDDQRGLAPQDLELPEFLRRESAPASLASQQEQTSHQDRDLISEIDDYVESMTESYAAYTRENTPYRSSDIKDSADLRTLHHFRTFGTPKLKCVDKSFSEDGIVPSYEDAESLFQSSQDMEADFDDPCLMEKSLADIGISSGYNKYLSKSRNFVKQRPKPINPVIIQTDSKGLGVEVTSPNQTLRGDLLNQSDILESTLVNSPSSSPYSSDSSLEKENYYSRLNRGKFKMQPNARHTKLHSPITATEHDDSLSLVDTDGKTRHTTHTINTVALSPSQTVQAPSPLSQSTKKNEVTFV